MMENITFFSGTIILCVIILVFVFLYYKRLINLNKEYSEAKSIIEKIIFTFKNRYDQLDFNIDKLKKQISFYKQESQEAIEKIQIMYNNIENDIQNLKKTKDLNEVILSDISILRDEIKHLKEVKDTFQVKTSIQSAQIMPVLEKESLSLRESTTSKIDIQLTETEDIIVHYLLSEGPKTAKEVELKIGKTREHTARLMKKLWQQGYVERETHKMPFKYRVSEILNNVEKTS